MAFLKDLDRELKIGSFLYKACHKGLVGLGEKNDLLSLLKEREPSNPAVRQELSRQKNRFTAWLGMVRQTSQEGAAGKIDNLLVTINSFIAIFFVAALVPVFYIYRDVTWIIPVLAACPLIHFAAWRLSGNPDVDRAFVKDMHLFAAVVSAVPMFFLALYASGYLECFQRGPVLAGTVACLWAAYTIVTALLIRTEKSFYFALFVGGFTANAALLGGRNDVAGTVSLNLLVAALLSCLAKKAAEGAYAMSAGRLRRTAGFFLVLALAFVFVLFSPGGRYGERSGLGVAIPLYAAALALLPLVLKIEAGRLAENGLKRCSLALFTATWLYIGCALFGEAAFGVRDLGHDFSVDTFAHVFLYLLLGIALTWNIWLLYEQLAAKKGFNTSIFSFAALMLVVCLTTGYFVLALKIGYVAALCLAVAVFIVMVKLRKGYVLPPDYVGIKTHPADEVPEPSGADSASGGAGTEDYG